MSSNGDLLATIDAEIVTAEQRVAQIEAEIEAKKGQRREALAEVRKLRSARAVLNGDRKGGSRTGVSKAGPAAVKKVRDTAQKRGKVTQAEITRETGLNSGQVSAAVKALEADGVLRETGVRIGRTRELEYAG